MLFVSLENFGPLTDAAFLLSHISHEADVKASGSRLSIITSDGYRHYVAALHIWEPFFVDYYVRHHISSRISLQTFRRTLRQAGENHCSSITIPYERTQNTQTPLPSISKFKLVLFSLFITFSSSPHNNIICVFYPFLAFHSWIDLDRSQQNIKLYCNNFKNSHFLFK